MLVNYGAKPKSCGTVGPSDRRTGREGDAYRKLRSPWHISSGLEMSLGHGS